MKWSLKDRQDLDMRRGPEEDVPDRQHNIQRQPTTDYRNTSVYFCWSTDFKLEMLEVVKSSENFCNLSRSFNLHFQRVAQSTFSRHGTSEQ